MLKRMRGHGAPGLSGLVAEVIRATGDAGIQWILDLCNGIVKEGASLGIGNRVCCCQSAGARVTQWSVDHVEESGCWNML